MGEEPDERPVDRPVEDPRQEAGEGQVAGPLPQDYSAADTGETEQDDTTPDIGVINRSG